MCMASSSTGLVQQPQPLWVRKYHSPAKGAASQRFFPNRSCSASRGLFCDQLLQGQKVIAFPAVPVWRGLWVVLELLCTGSSVRTWSSTSYLSPRKCGRGVFLSQHLFAFPMQIPSSGFSIPLNLWAQLFSLMDMKTHDHPSSLWLHEGCQPNAYLTSDSVFLFLAPVFSSPLFPTYFLLQLTVPCWHGG